MKSAISIISLSLALSLPATTAGADRLREKMLREYAIDAGIVPPETLLPPIDTAKSQAGRLLFASKELSLGRDIACKSCHLSRFGSADGLPNAFGTQASGEGIDRMRGGGDILPRNTMPLWGRGSIGFDVFFWDGKVDASSGPVRSQFGDSPPSDDPLIVAAHLPMVEIREMVPDVDQTKPLMTESLDTVAQIYAELVNRVKREPHLSGALEAAYHESSDGITMLQIAESIAMFFRDRFRIRETPFHAFVFDNGRLTDNEIAGGLLFYGKARCAACHNGPFFSDQKFHAIPFPEAGFGKTGFGIDYGRFNVTMDPDDRYKFRTPPLFNVTETAPYSHSGSAADLKTAILAHTDPLTIARTDAMTGPQRVEFYKLLQIWTKEPSYAVYLDDREIASLVAFLGTLSFPDPNREDD